MDQFCESRNGSEKQNEVLVLVAIGANLPGPDGRSPIDTCRQAVSAMHLLQNLQFRGLSRWFVAAPVPPSDQPDYVNAVALLVVDHGMTIDPEMLLSRLMQIEAASGRQRGLANAARTLDLDLIAIGDMVRSASDPILPHPRAHQRAFVLAPLIDVAPDWVHPVLGQTATMLLAALPVQPIRAL